MDRPMKEKIIVNNGEDFIMDVCEICDKIIIFHHEFWGYDEKGNKEDFLDRCKKCDKKV